MKRSVQIVLGGILLHWWIVDVILAWQTDWTEILWFTSTAFLIGSIALFTNDSYILSMVIIPAVSLESLWILDYIIFIVSGVFPFGFAAYMNDPAIPLLDFYVGLGHLFLLPILFYSFMKMRFYKSALLGTTYYAIIIVTLAHFFSSIEENINCVFRLCGNTTFSFGFPLLHMVVWIILLVIVLFYPASYILWFIKKKTVQ